MKEYLSKIYSNSKEDYFLFLKKSLEEGKKQFIITVNPETIMLADKNPLLSKMLLDKSVSLTPDGIAIVKACQKESIKITERITGIEISEFLLKEANIKGYSLYLFGAKQEVVESLAKKINTEYPSINLLGYSNGYVQNKEQIMQNIIKLKPDICLVALGIPLQEEIIYKYLSKAKKGIFIGVGGSFDVMSGNKKRAPKIFIKLNLEWLYRIIKEPNRIKRFYKNNIRFLVKLYEMKYNRLFKKKKK